MAEGNGFIDKTQFVFKGRDHMNVIRAIMANTRKVAAMFTLQEPKDPETYRFLYQPNFRQSMNSNLSVIKLE